MTVVRTGQTDTVWTTVEPTDFHSRSLPTWKPNERRNGYRVYQRPLAHKIGRRTIKGLDPSLIVASWAIIASRYHPEKTHVAFGLVEKDSSGTYRMWPQLVNASPEQTVQEWHNALKQARNFNLVAADIGQMLGLGGPDPLVATLVAVDSLAKPICSDDANDPRMTIVRQHRCSLLVVMAAAHRAPALHLVFDEAIYHIEAIQQLAHQVAVVFHALVAARVSSSQCNSTLQIKDIPWVSEEEIVQITHLATTPRGTEKMPNHWRPVYDRLDHWAIQTPDQFAVIDGDNVVTYRQLSEYVHQLAYVLQSVHGVTRETRVAFLGRRSLAAAVAIMAIVHAGGTFVPIDSQLPSDRVSYILSDSGARLLLTTQRAAEHIPATFGGPIVVVDKYCTVPLVPPAGGALHSQVRPHDLAYIMYTSGTTGRPKGVMVEYGSLVNHITQEPLFGQTFYYPGARVLLFFNIAFDGYLFDFFGALWHGATLVMMGDDPLSDFKRVDIVLSTPSFWAKIEPADCPNVKVVRVGGEPCPSTLVEKWADWCEIYNIYGPTEATMLSLVAKLARGQPLAIGKPFANVSVYVVDCDLHLVPMGVIGELLIGGAGVARGYCNLPELTAERFLPNPFGPGRVYRTGDLVRWLPDGNLEYIGRRDNQVKLNGFRIELEEVESVAGQCSQVQQAAVLVHRNHLVCFVTPALSDFAALADHLRQKLPHYMVPHTLVALAQLPTTVNGKVDKRALADLDLDSTTHCSLVADSAILDLDTDTALDTASDNAFADQEAVLRQAWAELLDVPVDRIARQAHFFQLGGDSIVAILLVSKCRQQGYQLTVPTVYAHPVLAPLARYLVPLHAATTNSALCTQAPVTGAVPLTPIQQWFFGLPLQNPHHFNQSFLLKLNPRVDANAIQNALVTLLTHHDMLRCRYTQHDNQWHQAIPTAEATHDDFFWTECHTTEAELFRHLAKLHTQLSLTQGPLLGALLVHLNDLPDQPRLYLVSHHIVIDLVSWRILIDDLNTLLSHQPLPPKTLSFAKWAASLDAHAAMLTADCWPEQVSLTNAISPIPADQVGTRHSIFQTLDATITDQLVTHVCPALRVTPRDAILSAYALAYCQTLDTAQVNLCMEGHGREPWSPDLDISRTVGWFTSLYPLVVRANSGIDLMAVIHQTKEHLQQIPTKGFPYSLLKYSTSTKADERNQLLAKTPAHLDVLFNYFGRFTQSTATDQSLVSIDWSDQYGEHDNPTVDWVPFDQYVMAMISGGTLRLGIDYNAGRCTDAIMTTLLATWATHLRDLVQAFAANLTAISPAVTRFEFDLLPLTSSDFDQLSTQLIQRNLAWHQVEDLYPCTPLQSGLLISTLRNPHAYLVQCHVTLTGNLDIAHLEASWQQVALRHSILRTVFLDAPSQVSTGYVQAVLTKSIVRFNAEPITSTDGLIVSNGDWPDQFEYLAATSAIEVTLTSQQGSSTHTMSVTFHHALLDGWSLSLLLDQVLSCYHGASGLTLTNFKSVVHHTHQAVAPLRQAEFWQAYLAKVQPTPAPLIHPRFGSSSGYYAYRVPLPTPKATLVHFAQRQGISLSTLLRAAYAVLLARYMHLNDVVFGVVVSGRNLDLDEITSTIGPCLNTVPVRVSIGNQPIISWLHGVHQEYIRMIPHEQSSLVDIARWSNVPHGARLFNAIMGFENQPPVSSTGQDTLKVEAIEVEEYTEYPFSVAFEDQPNSLRCKVAWAKGISSAQVGPDVVKHLAHILDQIVTSNDDTLLPSIGLEPTESALPQPLIPPKPLLLETLAQNLSDTFSLRYRERANCPVLTNAQRTYTWSDLEAMVTSLGQGIVDHHANQTQLVLTVVDNQLALMVSLLLAIKYQVTVVPISADHSIRSLNQLLGHLSPTLALVPATFKQRLALDDTVPQLILDDYCATSAAFVHSHVTDGTSPDTRSIDYTVRLVQRWDGDQAVLTDIPNHALAGACLDSPFQAPKGARVHHAFSLDSEAALWTTIVCLYQDYHIVDATMTDTFPLICVTGVDAAIPVQSLHPTETVHVASLAGLKTGHAFRDDYQPTTVLLFHTSLFADRMTLTLDEYQCCVAENTLPATSPWTVVDFDGRACPVGVPGMVHPVGPLVPSLTAKCGQYEPYQLSCAHFLSSQLPAVYGYQSIEGTIVVASIGQPSSVVEGIPLYPELVHPIFIQVGLRPVHVAITSGARLVVLVSNAEFDLTSYDAALTRSLPWALLPVAILSTAVFPHLHDIKTDSHGLDAFVAVYRQALLHRTTLTTKVQQWLAVHWIALGNPPCSDSNALASGFWEMGGTLADLVSLRHRIRTRFGTSLSIQDMHSHARFSTMCLLIEERLANHNGALPTEPSKTQRKLVGPVLDVLPATPVQLRAWCQMQHDGPANDWYHQRVYLINGTVAVPKLRCAFAWLIETHEELRTTVFEAKGHLRQRIHGMPLSATSNFFTALHQDGPLAMATVMDILDQHHVGMAIDTWPLATMVIMCISVPEPSVYVSLRLHPLIGGPPALAALGHQLWQCYDTLVQGLTANSLIATSQNQLPCCLTKPKPSLATDVLAYWQQLIADVPTTLNLPTDGYAHGGSSHLLQTVCHTLSESTHAQLHQKAVQARVDPVLVLLTLISAYLARLTRQDDVLLGVQLPAAAIQPSSSSELPTHPAALLFHGQHACPSSLPEALAQTQQQLDLSLPYAPYSLEALVDALGLGSDDLYATVPSVAIEFCVQPVHSEESLSTAFSQVIAMGRAPGPALHLVVSLNEQSVVLTAHHCLDQVGTKLIHNLLANFDHFSHHVFNHPDQLATGPMTRPEEQDEILTHYVPGRSLDDLGTDVSCNDVCNLVDSVRITATKHPAFVALDYGGQVTTYHHLIHQVNTMAEALAAHGVVAQVPVAVFVENCPATIVTMLALWHLGAVYVPIDTKLPMVRQRYMVETAKCTIFVDATTGGTEWPEALSFAQLLASTPSTDLRQYYCFDPTDWVYIIFTSGTTGQPKGVPIQHRGLVNLAQQDPMQLCSQPGTRLLQSMSPGFDAHIYLTMLGLYHRSTLVLPHDGWTKAIPQVDTLALTPSMLSVLEPADCPNLQTLAVGAEPLSLAVAQQWLAHCPVYNVYGPTETTAMSHYSRALPDQRITIGQTIANVTCYILDPHRQIVPVGGVGEIYIGGVGVSPGYLNRPELNKTHFIPNPFGDGTLYATGDLGRWLGNGKVECLGRIDSQVKIRGHRIELTEVSNALLAHPTVKTAETLVYRKQLVAFVTPSTVNSAHLLRVLVAHLPNYMVPAHIIVLTALPQNSNRKIDHKALKAYFEQYQTELGSATARHPQQPSQYYPILRQALARVLGVAESTINGNLSFFQNGGDSISAIRLSSCISQSGYTLPTLQILQHTTLSQLCEQMQPVDRPSAEAEMRRLDATQFPLTPFQQYLANHSQGKSIAHPRHLRTIELTRQLTVEQVNHALHQLTTRHAALCCRFNRLRDGQWTQRFDHPSPGPLALVDSLNCASTDLDMRLASVVCQLDIRRGPVIRAALVTLVDAPQLTLLVLAAPYLVVDDPSWDILFQDLSDILDNRSLSPIQLRYPLWLTEFQAQGLRRSLKHDPIQPIAALPKLSQRLVGCDYTANVQRQTIQLPEPLVAILDQVMSTPSRWGVTCTDLVTIALLQILSEDANDISTTLWCQTTQRTASVLGKGAAGMIGQLDALFSFTAFSSTAQSWLQRFQHVKQALRVAQRNSCSYQQDALDFDPLLPKSTGKVLLRLRHQPQECPLGQQRFDLTPMVTSDQWTNRVWDLVWTINNVAILQELGIEVTSTRLPSAELNRVAKRFEMRLQEVARDFSQALDAMPALWVPAEFPHVALTFDKLSWLEQELLASNLTANQVQTVYPLLSNLQAMLWATVSQASHYVNQFVVTIHGLSHPTQLHQAISQVVSRHEALRSRFFFTRSGPLLEGVQVVLDPLVSVKWAWAMDWPSLGATDENTYLRLPQAQGFEDVHGAMFQCTAVGAPADGIRLVMTVHHALVDGWSFGLLLQELVHTLNGGLDQPSLSRPVSLGGYMAFQAAYDHQADRDFWHNYLEGITSCTALCSPPSSSAVVRYGLHKRTLPLDLGALQMAVQSHGLTVHCVLAVAWALVLQMHTGRHDVVFGNTVSGRSVGVPRIDEMIGCLIVDVPLRVQLVPTRTLGELLETMRQDLVDTTAHAACPLSQAQTWMDGPLDAYCLYNTLLVYENDLTGVPTAGYHAVYLDDLSVHGGDDCDCTLTFTMVGAAFGVVMSCNRTKISAEYGQLLLDHLQHCLLLLRDHLVSNCLETLVNNLPLPKNE